MIKKVYLIVNPKKDPERKNREEIIRLLESKGIGYVEPAGEIDPDDARICDAVFTVGGDGTLIQAARELRSLDIPFFPINIGTLGYLTESTMATADKDLDRLIAGDYRIQERMRIAGTMPDGTVMTALNDVVIIRRESLHIVRLNLYINDKLVHTYRADGIIVSTSTGSTGYNLAAGGAILEPESKMMIVTPICPHTVRLTSLVVSDSDELKIEFLPGHEPDLTVVAGFDGGEMHPLQEGESVCVRRAEEKTKLIRFEDDSFLDVLYKKMKEN